MSLSLSIAICTWNRAQLLSKTLGEIERLFIPADTKWEVIVVDNSSTDDTKKIIEEYRSRLPLVGLFEAKQGHSHARNCAIDNAKGDYIIWTDDDVLVDSNWLNAYANAIKSNLDVDFFGGPVEPWFEHHPPKWIVDNIELLQGPFAIRHDSATDTPISNSNLPFGANMAFRSQVLRQNRFDTRLGRKGAGMLSGDETTLMRQLMKQGCTGCWVRGAQVRHFIPSKRLTERYVYSFSRGIAEGNVLIALERGPFPRWSIKQWLVENSVRMINYPSRNRRWLMSLLKAAQAEGTIRGWLKFRKVNGSRV